MRTLSRTLRGAAGAAAWAALATSVLLAGCGGSSTPTSAPTPAPEIKTETFNGTVTQGGAASNLFTVAAQGTITVTLTSLSPQSTVTSGFGIGQPSGTSCTLLTGAYTESAKVGYVMSGTIAAGSYCVGIYDIGNFTSSNDYVITISHP
jgi:hypothetical protein